MKLRRLSITGLFAVSALAQTSALAPVPRQQPLSNSGLILPGGCLYSFSAGTTTPQNTYSNSTLATPNTNPIVLDSSGRAPAIYWNGTAIKLVLANKFLGSCPGSPGTVIWSQDNIADSGIAARAALEAYKVLLASASGAGLIGFQQNGSGTLRTVQKKLEEDISVLDFGASAGGVIDSTAAVQAAINIAPSGATVTFPRGSYVLGAITMKSGVTLTCASGTILFARDNSEIMFNTGSGVNRTGLSGIGGYCTIDSNSKTGFQAIAILARGSFSTSNIYRNLLINSPAIGIQTQGTFFNLFENIRVVGPTTGAYLFEAETTTTYCTNCSAIATVGTPIGFTIHNGNGFVFTGGTFEGTVQNSVYQTGQIVFNSTYFENGGTTVNAYVTIGTSATNVTQSVDFQGCFFNSGANFALDIYQVEGLVVNGSTIQTNTAAYQIEPNAAPASADRLKRGLQISNNTFNVGGAGFNPATIFSFGGNPVNDLSSNVSMDQINPLKFSGSVIGGTVLAPQAASMTTGEGTLYIDPTTGILGYRYKDGAAAIQNGVSVGAKCYYFRPGVIDSEQSICWEDAATGLLDGPVIRGHGGARIVTLSGTVAQFGGWNGVAYIGDQITFPLVPGSYADNAAAITAGLTAGMIYRSGDALNIVH